MQETFQTRIDAQQVIVRDVTRRFNLFGYLKLILVVLLLVTLWQTGAQGYPPILWVASGLTFVLLACAWVHHNRLHERLRRATGLIAIDRAHIARITGEWVAAKDTGAEFADAGHPYACDLDIVGPKSFFQYLNTTHTWHGRQAFAADLLEADLTESEIRQRQEAILELSGDIDYLCDLEYRFSRIGVDPSAPKLVAELSDRRAFVKSPLLRLIIRFAPVAVFLFLVAVVLFRLTPLYLPAVVLAGLQMLIWGAGMTKTGGYFHAVGHLPYKLDAYNAIIDALKSRTFEAPRLRELQSRLATGPNSAAQALRELSGISEMVNVRHNGILAFVLNVLLLWDFECALRYEDWKRKYAGHAEGWFTAFGAFESLLCFSVLPNVCEGVCLPQIVAGKRISARDMGHPLIRNDVRVRNAVDCDGDIAIISGSNMSGKTTYLRTIGINMVLARAGSYVCAARMEGSLMRVMTSMRIADDLGEGISTFYAELRRIKAIMSAARVDSNLLFLIDEIFKGTNSVDRISGARTVIEALSALGAVGYISTHDLELCDLAERADPGRGQAIRNYSFSERYEADGIHFDYRLRPGKSTTTNARYLMKMVGILEADA